MGCHYVAYSTLQWLASGTYLIFPHATPDSEYPGRGQARPLPYADRLAACGCPGEKERVWASRRSRLAHTRSFSPGWGEADLRESGKVSERRKTYLTGQAQDPYNIRRAGKDTAMITTRQ